MALAIKGLDVHGQNLVQRQAARTIHHFLGAPCESGALNAEDEEYDDPECHCQQDRGIMSRLLQMS